MTQRIRIELLPDALEEIISRFRSLQNAGLSRLTPLGVLYLLAISETRQEVQRITGFEAAVFAELVLEELKRLYSDNSSFATTVDTIALIDKTAEIAGGPNKANVGHLLLAMLSASADHTDAHQFLSKLGVSEATIKKSMQTSPTGTTPLLDRLTTDFAQEAAILTEVLYESPHHTSLITRVLAMLNKRTLANVVLTGFPGVGRHTLAALLASQIQSGHFQAFKGFQIRKLNWNAIEGQPRPQESLTELTNNLQQVILILDNLTPERVSLCLPLFESKTPVLGIATSAEEKQFTSAIVGKATTVAIDEPAADVIKQILQAHMKQLVAYHHLEGRQELDEREIDMLTRLGPSISGLSLPGGAVHLLDLAASHDSLFGDRVLEASDIALIIQETTDISVGALTESQAQRFAKVPDILNGRIIGQKSAKQALINALNRAQAGLRDQKKPLGVFVFLGPTGVGKTETVKALAEALFDDEDMLVRIDLSEYQEPHTVSRLVGAPPGYVGYDEGGQLTDAVRRRPFCVILFDEADKAHPDVYNILLQMMDDGRLTDGQGRTVDFRNTVIIFTSNHGSAMIVQEIEAGNSFEQISQETIEWFKDQVPPEFYNRIEEVIVFEPISPDDAWLILDLQLRRMIEIPTKDRYGISVECTQSAKVFLHSQGYSAQYGARPLQRAINRYVGTPLSSILLGDLTGVTTITCNHEEPNGQLTLTRNPS